MEGGFLALTDSKPYFTNCLQCEYGKCGACASLVLSTQGYISKISAVKFCACFRNGHDKIKVIQEQKRRKN